MLTSPYFSHAAAGGAGAPPSAVTAAAVFEAPQLDVALYHYTVFTMPLDSKRKIKHAKIAVYFDKETLQTVYVCNWQALAVLCDEKASVIQNAHGAFISRKKDTKKVFLINVRKNP